MRTSYTALLLHAGVVALNEAFVTDGAFDRSIYSLHNPRLQVCGCRLGLLLHARSQQQGLTHCRRSSWRQPIRWIRLVHHMSAQAQPLSLLPWSVLSEVALRAFSPTWQTASCAPCELPCLPTCYWHTCAIEVLVTSSPKKQGLCRRAWDHALPKAAHLSGQNHVHLSLPSRTCRDCQSCAGQAGRRRAAVARHGERRVPWNHGAVPAAARGVAGARREAGGGEIAGRRKEPKQGWLVISVAISLHNLTIHAAPLNILLAT